jgi:hypothetical protein
MSGEYRSGPQKNKKGAAAMSEGAKSVTTPPVLTRLILFSAFNPYFGFFPTMNRSRMRGIYGKR